MMGVNSVEGIDVRERGTGRYTWNWCLYHYLYLILVVACVMLSCFGLHLAWMLENPQFCFDICVELNFRLVFAYTIILFNKSEISGNFSWSLSFHIVVVNLFDSINCIPSSKHYCSVTEEILFFLFSQMFKIVFCES